MEKEKITMAWIFRYGELKRRIAFNYGMDKITHEQNQRYHQLVLNALHNKFLKP